METSDETWIETACQWLQASESEHAHDRATTEHVTQAIAAAEPPQLAHLVDLLVSRIDLGSIHPSRLRLLMQVLAARLLQCLSTADGEQREGLLDQPLVSPSALTELYQRLSELDGPAAAHALQMLAAQPDEESIDLLAGLLAESPPVDWKQVALGLSPLWNADSERLAFFFERLDSDHLHPATLSILIDLAGYATRKGKLAEHPWTGRQTKLASLLSSVCQRLYSLEREPAKFGSDVAEVQRVLGDSVSLTISLCDALGLVGSEHESSPCLATSHAALSPPHSGRGSRRWLGSGRGGTPAIVGARSRSSRGGCAVSYAERAGLRRID
ncbi:MAG: hypothetical protein R3C56_15905 [Pirellulaceae bacterium]